MVLEKTLAFTTQDADVLANGSDTDSQAIPAGYMLTQEAVDVVNRSIDYGEFSLADGKLVFTQNEAYGHEEGTDEHTFEPVSFVVSDANGNATTLDVTVKIEDDEPTISVNNPPSRARLRKTNILRFLSVTLYWVRSLFSSM